MLNVIPGRLCRRQCDVRLTEATAVAWHDHEGAQASPDDALRPSQRRLFEGARVLVEEGVDTVGRRGATVPHYRLCRKTNRLFCYWVE